MHVRFAPKADIKRAMPRVSLRANSDMRMSCAKSATSYLLQLLIEPEVAPVRQDCIAIRIFPSTVDYRLVPFTRPPYVDWRARLIVSGESNELVRSFRPHRNCH